MANNMQGQCFSVFYFDTCFLLFLPLLFAPAECVRACVCVGEKGRAIYAFRLQSTLTICCFVHAGEQHEVISVREGTR